jgi:hypothetical protein
MVDPGWPFDSPDSSDSNSRTEGSNDDKLRAENLADFEPAELVHGLLNVSSSDSTALSGSAPVYVESDDEGDLDGVLQMGCMDGFFMPKKKQNTKNSLIHVNEMGEKELKLNLKFPLALGFSKKKVDSQQSTKGESQKHEDNAPNDGTKTSRLGSVLEKMNCKGADQSITECNGNSHLLQSEYHTHQDAFENENPDLRLGRDPPASVAMVGGHNDLERRPGEAISHIFTSLMSLSHGSSADDDYDSNVRPENLVLPPLPQPIYHVSVHAAPPPTAMWHQQQAYLPQNIPYELIAKGIVHPNIGYLPSNYWQNAPPVPLNFPQPGHNIAGPPAIARMPSQILVQEQESFGEEASLSSYDVVAGTEPTLNVTQYIPTGQGRGYRQGYFTLPPATRGSKHDSSRLMTQSAHATGAEVFGGHFPPNASQRDSAQPTPMTRMRFAAHTAASPTLARSILSADSEQETMLKGAESEFKGEEQAGSVSSTNVEEGSRTSVAKSKLVKSDDGIDHENHIKNDPKSAEAKEVLKSSSSSSSGKVRRPPKAQQWRQANTQRLKHQQQLQSRRSASPNTVESGNENSSSSFSVKKAGETLGSKDRDGPSFDERPVQGEGTMLTNMTSRENGSVSNSLQHLKETTSNSDTEQSLTKENELNIESRPTEEGFNDDETVDSDQAIVAFLGQEYAEAKAKETPSADSFQKKHTWESNDIDTKHPQQAHYSSRSAIPHQQGSRESTPKAQRDEISFEPKQASPPEPISKINSNGMDAKIVETEQKHGEKEMEGDASLSLVFDSIFTRRRQLRHAARQKNSAENLEEVLDRPPVDAGCEQNPVVACERSSMDSSDRPSMDASDRPSFDGNSAEDETENHVPLVGMAAYTGHFEENLDKTSASQSTQASKLHDYPIGNRSNLELPLTSLSKHQKGETVQEISTMSSTDAVFQPVFDVSGLSSPSKSVFFATAISMSRQDDLSTGKVSAPPMAPSPRASFSSVAPSPRGGSHMANNSSMLQIKPTMTSEWHDTVSSRGSTSTSGVLSPSNALSPRSPSPRLRAPSPRASFSSMAPSSRGGGHTANNSSVLQIKPTMTSEWHDTVSSRGSTSTSGVLSPCNALSPRSPASRAPVGKTNFQAPSLYLLPTFTSEWHDTVQSPTNSTRKPTFRGTQLCASTSITDEGSEAVEVIDLPGSSSGSGSFVSAEFYETEMYDNPSRGMEA